jgi:hypothetical protein
LRYVAFCHVRTLLAAGNLSNLVGGSLGLGLLQLDRRDQLALAHPAHACDAERGGETLQLCEQHPG